MFWLRNKKNNFEIHTLIEVGCCILLQVVILTLSYLEHSGSVVECLTRDREAQVRVSPASLRCGP